MIMLYLTSIIITAFILYIYCVIVKYPKLALAYEKTKEVKLFERAKHTNFTEIVYSAFPMAVIIILLKMFFVDIVTVPSGSMLPTYPIGSMAFINKTAFGVRSPLTGKPLTGGRYPLLGEAVVTKFPLNPDVMYIKRVVGLPGDEISLSSDSLVINNIKHAFKKVGQIEVPLNNEKILHDVYDISIGSISYQVIVDANKEFPKISHLKVPSNSFYVLGDNLTGSGDSRMFGAVPWRYFIGSVI